MSFELERDEPLSASVRRCARELVADSLARLGTLASARDDEALVEGVHEVRKNAKKLRGLLRLVRPGLGSAYDRANASFRDAARTLSATRDAQALVETFDALDTPGELRPVRARLEADRAAATAMLRRDRSPIAEAAQRYEAGRDALEARLRDTEVTPEHLRGGIRKTYARARARGEKASGRPSVEVLHQWRKRIKYGWYHLRLLAPAAPSILGPLADRLHDLSDALGDDHDLAVLRSKLRDDPDAYGGAEVAARAEAFLVEAQRELQRRALRLGPRVFLERPRVFAERVVGYWHVWQRVGDELPTGELEA